MEGRTILTNTDAVEGLEKSGLLTKPDFSKTEVVRAYVHTIVVPAMDYWKQTIEDKKGAISKSMSRRQQLSIKVSLIAVKQAWISKSIKVSLIAVNHIIVKKVSLKLSLIAVNVIDYHFHLLQ